MESKDRELSVGDDGLYMTKRRIRLHRSLNVAVVWGIISFIGTLAFAAAAYFQGQTFNGLELIAYGGNTFKGYYTADLLRIEAGVCFISGILFVVLYQAGFTWFYEKRNKPAYLVASIGIILVAFIWEIFLLTIGVFDVLSLLSLVLTVVVFTFMSQVKQEQKTKNLNI